MKKLLTAIFTLLFVLNLSAQKQNTVTADNPVVEKFTQIYNFNDAQVEKMIKVQERRLRNLAEIQTLRATDAKTYHQKRNAINKGTEVSIGLILNPEQIVILNEARVNLRKEKAKKTIELKEAGLSYEEIQIALIDLEDTLY